LKTFEMLGIYLGGVMPGCVDADRNHGFTPMNTDKVEEITVFIRGDMGLGRLGEAGLPGRFR
jgi:hypothetical protein